MAPHPPPHPPMTPDDPTPPRARAVGRPLYPPIEPYRSGMLRVDGRHTIYWEESGHPEGVPVIFLHGGPGSGSAPYHRRFFDPAYWRIVIFDQRGAGRSRPSGDVTDNTTAHLIADIEKLRRHLGISRWLVFGGSWGATLALAYGERFAERCLGFVLRGVFLARPRELSWFLGGMATVFPEAWRAFLKHLPPEERQDPARHYYARLMNENPDIHMPAARAWVRYETACSTLLPPTRNDGSPNYGRQTLALARIEAHYFVNTMFLDDNQLLDNIDTITHLPCAIVQGRYDIVCPIVTADTLARAWPGCSYTIGDDAGHSALEPALCKGLVEAVEGMKARVS